ncbi:uncharacterized protein LOC131029649 [Cryptomeria japonica]|uniref:uncharacterized protein LOC131029649 n=1 Tax=Cryptomeria japonica TaxID=3369 RepID=UPI0025AC4802|nr:uncharacterized protein LOC131029649 [Cryptomeria japonica]
MRSNLKQQVLQNLSEDEHYLKAKQALGVDPSDHRFDGYKVEPDGILRFQRRMYIPEGGDLRKLILHECLECQRLKVEHVHPAGLLYQHHIPEHKWQVINMDFIQGLPLSKNKHDTILVVVDKLSKVAHFVPEKA